MSPDVHAHDSGPDRRRAPRFPLDLPVKVVYGTAPVEAQFGSTADVSTIGALLLLPREIAPGTELQLRVSLPRDLADRSSQAVDMVASGTVTRVFRRDHRPAIGVEIRSLTPIAEA